MIDDIIVAYFVEFAGGGPGVNMGGNEIQHLGGEAAGATHRGEVVAIVNLDLAPVGRIDWLVLGHAGFLTQHCDCDAGVDSRVNMVGRETMHKPSSVGERARPGLKPT